MATCYRSNHTMQRIDAAAYPADPFEGIVTDRNMVGQATGVAIEPLQHTVSADGTGAGNVIDRADDGCLVAVLVDVQLGGAVDVDVVGSIGRLFLVRL